MSATRQISSVGWSFAASLAAVGFASGCASSGTAEKIQSSRAAQEIEVTSRGWSLFGQTDQGSAPANGEARTCAQSPELPQPSTLLVAEIGVAHAPPKGSFTLTASGTSGLVILRPTHPLVRPFVLSRVPVQLGITVVGRNRAAPLRGRVTAEMRTEAGVLTRFTITLRPGGSC